MIKHSKQKIFFSQFSTAGNTTLFLDSAESGQEKSQGITARQVEYLAQSMRLIPVEQAGCVDFQRNILKMAGGEFCLNATLAYAVLSSLRRPYPACKLTIAGVNVHVTCCGQEPEWVAKAEFEKKLCAQKETEAGIVVTIPGISHLLYKTDEFPDHATALTIGKELFKKLGLDQEPAAGIIWYLQKAGELEILPLVLVPKAGTLNFEAACGSGSVALGYFLGTGKYRIRQPSGEMIVVSIKDNKIGIRAIVQELVCGSFWL